MALGGALTITDEAAGRARQILARAGDDVLGLRVGVKQAGCSGMMYEVDYAREQQPLDEVIDANGVRFFIDASALMYLFGSEMDYREDKFHSGFVFNNPNETARCGCGESFMVS